MTTPRRPFNRAAFLAGYRAACEANAVDPTTGNPEAWDDPHWWARPELWHESGRNHSSTEAAALANVAAQARRAQSLPAMNPESEYALRPSVKAEVAAWAADCVPPLREIHRRQGVVVDEILGVRMIVPIRKPA